MNRRPAQGAAERVVMTVRLDEPEANAERLEELTAAVREDLLGMNIENVSLARTGPAPAGARAPDATAIGELVLVLGSSTALLHEVVGVLTAWRERRRPRSVEMRVGDTSLRLDEANEKQQERLVSEFLRTLRRG